MLTKYTIFFFFIKTHILYINFNVFKKSISVYMYYIAKKALKKLLKNSKLTTYLLYIAIKLIAFFFCTLFNAKKKY